MVLNWASCRELDGRGSVLASYVLNPSQRFLVIIPINMMRRNPGPKGHTAIITTPVLCSLGVPQCQVLQKQNPHWLKHSLLPFDWLNSGQFQLGFILRIRVLIVTRWVWKIAKTTNLLFQATTQNKLLRSYINFTWNDRESNILFILGVFEIISAENLTLSHFAWLSLCLCISSFGLSGRFEYVNFMTSLFIISMTLLRVITLSNGTKKWTNLNL